MNTRFRRGARVQHGLNALYATVVAWPESRDGSITPGEYTAVVIDGQSYVSFWQAQFLREVIDIQ